MTDPVPNPQSRVLSRLLKTYSQNYLSVSIYLNRTVVGKEYYDIVIYRKIKDHHTGSQTWKRGANLKPSDLPDLLELASEVQQYLVARGVKVTRD